MSFQALNWALSLELGGPGEKIVLLALANYADENNDCYPSQERLARETCQGVRTVQRHLTRLEQLGLLSKHTRGGNGAGRWSNWYRLSVGAQPATLAGRGYPPSETGATRHLEQGYPPPVAQEPPLEPPLEEPPPSAGVPPAARGADDGGLFDAPEAPAAKKPGRQPDPVNVAAKALADYWVTLTDGMANFMAARAVSVKAVRAGHEQAAIRSAMDRLHEGRIPLTGGSLDIELRGGIRSGAPAKANGHRVYRDDDYWKD